MLTGLQVVILGGDARQLEMMTHFHERGAIVTMIGFEHGEHIRDGILRSPLTEEVLAQADVLILPVAGMNELGEVSCKFSNTNVSLEDRHFAALSPTCLLFTGMASSYLQELCNKHGIQFLELLKRDDVAIYNSIPTAEGALKLAIEHTAHTIHGSSCMVLGMGRTGFTLARTLQGIGAKVSVGIRRQAHYARAWEMGFQPFYVKDLVQSVKGVDLLFNTIPTMIVTAQVIDNIPLHAVIIDLASKPGGTDFRYADVRGVKAILAPGLPGIVAPKTAGSILAQSICAVLDENAKGTGE